MCQRKQSQKTIFIWFNNLPTSTELQGFHYSLEKKSKMWQYSFFSLQNNIETLMSKPPLYKLSLRKSPIKNHNNIILGQIIIRIKHN